MSIRGKIVGTWEIVEVIQIRKNSFQNPLVEVGQKLRSDPFYPSVSTVELCRPTSTVDIQRSCDYFRVQQSETWENLPLLELTPEIQPQTSPYVATWHGPNGWAGWNIAAG
jgi:hypothetical protein